MWKDYSSGYIKYNRSSGISIIIAAFISALLLSLLCSLFYNAWKYEVERIELEEGGWQSRIVLESDSVDIVAIQNYGNVREIVIKEGKRTDSETIIDIYFNNMRTVFDDTPKIARLVGCSPAAVSYNYELLAMYLIRSEQDTAPRLLFPMFILIMIMASFSLIVIIHNSFAFSMNGRIHQFGIFSSIGATPKQIRTCLLQEAASLCAVPVLAGNILGVAISMMLLQMVNVLLGKGVADRQEAVFGYHPLVFAVTLLVTVITIWISAWLPAGKLSKLTPLEAIKDTGELQLKRRRNSPVLTFLFGVEGELAGNALKAQRKALGTASLSLIFAFLAFTIMQCFFTLTQISTRETYFERYQSVWDIMVAVKDTDIESFDEIGKIQGLSEVRNAILYQKAMAKTVVVEEEMSQEMKSLGGFSHAADSHVQKTDGGWRINAPIVVLDDKSFLDFCEQIGITPQLDGAVIRNRIRDVTNPDFRHPQYMPYVKGKKATSILEQSGKAEMIAEVQVLGYTDQVPALREEYGKIDYYELVHFVPVSLWRKIKGQIAGSEEDAYLCVLGRENVTLEELNHLQEEIMKNMTGTYLAESENRIQEYEANERQIQGTMAIFGGFCVLLAMIGIGNVFSNTLGFVRQRKREFARYMSLGVTPEEIRKMFCIEALVIAGRPILLTFPLAVLVVWFLLKSSYMEVEVFLAQAPLTPVVMFMLAMVGTVVLAYYLGWRNVQKINLAQALGDDTML